ncbi:AMP-binding protein [Treponema sp. TIM-1]|uniref:AMP-binding protein n=1 Tax=Treponema sp. TIM-1 TaxID=2898417 RepID=UPI003980DFEE
MIYLEKMTIAELGLRAAEKYRQRKAFEIYGDGHLYAGVSFEEFGLRIRQFAALLCSLGLKPGDRAMILSENRPEWAIAYFGTALAGVVIVPVLTDFPAGHIAGLAAHAEVSALWVSGKFAQKLGAAGFDPDIPVIYLDTLREEEAAGGEPTTHAPAAVGGSIRVSIRGKVKEIPLRKMDPRNPRVPLFPASGEDDLAAIIYTSGTTGTSKGVMLSHRNLIFTVLAARSLVKIFPRDRLFSIIPLAHTYECTLGLLMAVLSGASTTYLDKAPSPAVLIPAIQALRPTAMHTVPLIIEKIYRGRLLPGLTANPLYRFPLTRPLALSLAGQKLLSLFGGAVRFFGVGGAALAGDTERFLRKAQFPYAPGYGLTEAAPLVAGTGPFKAPAGAAGRVLKGVEVRIVDKDGRVVGTSLRGRTPYRPFAEGEIQVRGPNIMLGYYQDEGLTQEAFTADGWFKTGDLGCFDRRGFLYIRGRLKTMILGPSGENVYPEEIEGLLTSSGMAEDALVYPGERGELIALIVLSEKAKTMLAAIGEVLGDLKNAVNQKLASFSRISRIEIKNEPFEKTPTQKIKRFLYTPGGEK